MDALDENDAVQSFHERDGESKPLIEEQVNTPVAAEKHQHGHSADKGRHDKRDNSQTLDNDRPFELKPGGKVSQGH